MTRRTDKIELKSKDNEKKLRIDFLWPLGPTAAHEMITTEVGEKLFWLISVSTKYSTPSQNIYLGRRYDFRGKQ